MCIYFRIKFQVSNIILTGFRQGVILPPSPLPQNEPLKNPLRLGLKSTLNKNLLTEKMSFFKSAKMQRDRNSQRCFTKKLFLKISQYVRENTCVGLEAFIGKRLQHMRFPVNIVKFLRTPILKNICEQGCF